MRIAWLGDPESLDAATVGGKTASLGRLATSFRVPPGFCLDVEAYEHLRSALEGDSAARGRLRELVAAAYADLARRVGDAEPRVAVRSSAIGEDASGASFAGQHETVLDVSGVDPIVEALLECWRSLATERARAYRRERGITAVPRMAVLVQLMVPADASAIAFSADPVSGARDVVVVNAARGLGDAIASGAVTPDSYTVRKADLAIASRSAVDGGAIADREVEAIAQLTLQLEDVMGGPVDVECALHAGELHLLQCRPITTLPEEWVVEWEEPDDAKLVWRRDDAHQTGVVTPLSIEYTINGPGYGMRKRDEELGPPQLMRFAAFNGRLYNSVKPLLPPEEMGGRQREAVARRRKLARRIRRDWDERYLPELDEMYEWMRALDPEEMTREQSAFAWDELWRRHRRAWAIHMLVTAGSYTVMDELRQTYEELVGGPASEAFALTQGLAETLQRMDRDLYELTAAARRSPPIADAVMRRATCDELRRIDVGFGHAVDAFLADHGDAGQSGEGLPAPSWSDDPSLLVLTIAERMALGADDPDARLARLRANADDIARRARARLAGRPEELARFEEVLAAAISAGPLTEEHNYWLDRRNHAHVARAARRFGARLVREGALRDAEAIFLLYLPEVREALRAATDLSALTTERQAEQLRWKRMRAPDTLGAAPPPAQPGASTTIAMGHLLYTAEQDDPSRLLRGVGASSGVARGSARLIRGLAEFAKFQRGDVLVCQSSNVSWIPLFTSAAAVVTEVGGALSHAAVVAREFGVPCVVGTAVALKTLSDGEMLEVDGSAGTVRRLSKVDEFPIIWEGPEDAKLFWRREQAHFHQVFGPLAIEYIVNGPNYGIQKRAAEVGPPILIRHLAFNGHFYVNAKPLVPPENLPVELTAATARRRAHARHVRSEWDERYLPELKAHYAWMDAQAIDRMSRAEAAQVWADLWRRIRRAWTIHFIVVSPAYAVMEELAQTYEQLVGGNGADALVMTQGLTPTLQDLERGLSELTGAARRHTGVAQAIERGESSLDALRSMPGGAEFANSIDRFLEVHGDVGQEGFELGEPAYRDQPSRLLSSIRQRLRHAGEDPGSRYARVRRTADELADKARSHLTGRPSDLERFEEVLAAARSAGPITEEHNYWIDRVATAHVDRLVRKFGARLVAEGALGSAEEVLLLYIPEVEQALREPRDLASLVAERRDELGRWRAMRAPETIGVPPPGPPPMTPGVSLARVDLSFTVAQENTRVLKGVAASPGVARGPARLVREGEFSKMREGDILVCHASTVSWVPLFTIASAVVTEIGGALSHAAVVAREFGIPCVVATGVALSTLQDGEVVEVDGGAGIVKRLGTNS